MLVGAIRKKIAGCGDVDVEPRMLVMVVGDPNTYRGSSSFAGSIWKGKILRRGATICVGISSTTPREGSRGRSMPRHGSSFRLERRRSSASSSTDPV
jgi:hypothetical protein